MTPLGEKLIARIRANGPMTLADYMAACLSDPPARERRQANEVDAA